MSDGTISLEEAQERIKKLEAITKKRYRTMEIPFNHETIDWVTIIVPETMTAEDFKALSEKMEHIGALLTYKEKKK